MELADIKLTESADASTLTVDWALISAKLPTDKSQKDERKKIFKRMDVNGNGYLSLAEIDKGIRDVLQMDAVFDAKPVIMRAFQIARDVVPARKMVNKLGDNYVEFNEFRIFLLALRQRFEYWVAFKKIDSDHSGQIDIEEFIEAKETIEKWVESITDAEKTFDEIDVNGDGFIFFDEFCMWSVTQDLYMDG